MRFFRLCAVLALPVVLAVSGCNTAPQETQPRVATDGHDHGDHEHGGEVKADDPAIAEALGELSPDDRVLAEKQKKCPVTGELLGSMGAPIKLEVEGKTVFICCEGCRDKLLASPKEYLAKLHI